MEAAGPGAPAGLSVQDNPAVRTVASETVLALCAHLPTALTVLISDPPTPPAVCFCFCSCPFVLPVFSPSCTRKIRIVWFFRKGLGWCLWCFLQINSDLINCCRLGERELPPCLEALPGGKARSGERPFFANHGLLCKE